LLLKRLYEFFLVRTGWIFTLQALAEFWRNAELPPQSANHFASVSSQGGQALPQPPPAVIFCNSGSVILIIPKVRKKPSDEHVWMPRHTV
jgi:hypothetical protein